MRPRAEGIGEGGVVIGVGELGVIAERLPDRQRVPILGGHLGQVALPPACPPEGFDELRAKSWIVVRPRRPGHPFETPPRFREVAVLLPEAPHGEGDPDRHRRVGSCDGTVEDRSDIVVLELQAIEPASLVGAGQLGRGALDERDVPVTVAAVDPVDLPIGLQLLGRERPDRVEEPKAGFAIRRLLGLDQALVDQGHEAIEDVAAELGRRSADRLGRGQVAAAGEDRQAIEQASTAVIEELIAPGDRSAEGLLTSRQVARPRREDVELVVEPNEDRFR